MATSINWSTKVITIPKADTTLISSGPPELRELDVDAWRLELKALEDNEQGITYLRTHKHNTEVTLGGVTFARTVEIINGYTVTFENGSYQVRLAGANNNIADVLNLNNVQLISQNSAGLISIPDIAIIKKLLNNKQEIIDLGGGVYALRTYDDDDSSTLVTSTLKDKDGNDIVLQAGQPTSRTRGT